MKICLSHSGRTMYSLPEPADEMLVGTVDGIVFLQRKRLEEPWKVQRHALQGRHIVGLMIEPVAGAIFACAHNGGVAASVDGGVTWAARSKGIPFENVYCITCTVSEGSVRLYAGTEPAHLYFSDDLGANWEEIPSLRSVPSVSKWTFPVPPNLGHLKDIVVHPRDPRTLYVSVEQGGLFRSTDCGETWAELHGTLHNDDCHRLILSPSDPKKMFLPTGYGFYWSTDGGDSWENIGQRVPRVVYPDPMVANPNNGDLLLVSGACASPHTWLQTHCADPKVARTRDGGLTWQIVDRGLQDRLCASFEAMTLEAWGQTCAVYLGNTDGDIYGTFDEGDHWVKVATGLPPVSKTIHHVILRPDAGSGKDRETVGGIPLKSRYEYR